MLTQSFSDSAPVKVAVADWLSHPPAELKKAEPGVGDIAPTSPKQISEILLLSCNAGRPPKPLADKARLLGQL